MTTKEVEILQSLFSLLTTPATVRLDADMNLDEPVIVIDNEFFSIRNCEIERKTIGRTIKVPGYALDKSDYTPASRWEPENYDYSEIFADQNFFNVATRAVQEYLKSQTDGIAERLASEDMAKQLQEEKSQIAMAENDGYNACVEGRGEPNPYPRGIAQYYAWQKGWDVADHEADVRQS